MIEQRKYPSQPLNWFLFLISIPIALGGAYTLITHNYNSTNWTTGIPPFVWLFGPFWFYFEIMRKREGYIKVMALTKKLFKCRVRGTEEVFYVKADSESEVELFFETMMEGKTVFIEEANIKLISFDMEIPGEDTEVEEVPSETN